MTNIDTDILAQIMHAWEPFFGQAKVQDATTVLAEQAHEWQLIGQAFQDLGWAL